MYVQDVEVGAARPFNAVQVKKCMAPETLAHSFTTKIGRGLERFMSPDEDDVYLSENS